MNGSRESLDFKTARCNTDLMGFDADGKRHLSVLMPRASRGNEFKGTMARTSGDSSRSQTRRADRRGEFPVAAAHAGVGAAGSLGAAAQQRRPWICGSTHCLRELVMDARLFSESSDGVSEQSERSVHEDGA